MSGDLSQTHVAMRRRRSSSNEPLKRISLQISEPVYEAVRALVKSGEVASSNVFFEEAVRAKLQERRKATLYAAYEAAAGDPVFMREMSDHLEAFDSTLADGSKPGG